MYSIGFLVAWLVALLLVAELLRNTGRFTMADVLSFRLRERPVRTAAAISTIIVSLFYLLAQMVGAGGLVNLLLGVEGSGGQNLTIAVVGVIMLVYVLVGGMKGTTWVQIIKAVLLIAGAGLMTVWVLGKYGFNLSDLLGGRQRQGQGARQPGPAVRDEQHEQARTSSRSRWRSCSARPACRTSCMRFYTVPNSKEARRSGRVGDLAHRHLLPVHPGARLRRRAARRGQGDLGGSGQGELGRSAARVRARRHAAPRHHRGGRLRDHPRRRRGPDDHGVHVVRPRHLRQRHQAGPGLAGGRGPRGADHRRGRRHPGDPRWASWPRTRTSRSWSPSRSPSRRPRTCRRSSTRSSGSGSTPAARCGASTAASSRRSR